MMSRPRLRSRAILLSTLGLGRSRNLHRGASSAGYLIFSCLTARGSRQLWLAGFLKEERVCTGRDLAEALSKSELSAQEARAWHKDFAIVRCRLTVPRDTGQV